MRRVELKTLPGGQSGFVYDLTSPYKALVGGMGSGKTDGAVKATLLLGSINAPVPGYFVEPTFSIIKDAALPTFENILDDNEIHYDWHASEHVLTVGRGKRAFPILMRSGDRPHRIVGVNAWGGVIDEPGQQKPEVFKRVAQRMRHPLAKVLQVAMAGTPEGLNWFYRTCEGKPPNGMKLYRARTADNPFNPAGYLDNLVATLTPQEILAYAEGRFVNLTSGACYPSFDRAEHGAPCPNPLDGDVVVGCDFNVAKMVWPLAVRRGAELHVFDEVAGLNTDTFRMADALEERLREYHRVHAWHEARMVDGFARFKQRVRVHIDATGGARKTSASQSDKSILQEHGFNVVSATSNPPIRDRVHSLEQRFRLRAGNTGLLLRPATFVDVDRCKLLVEALEGQVWGVDGLPEKKQGQDDLSGPNDALGYLVWNFPDWQASVPRGNRVATQLYG